MASAVAVLCDTCTRDCGCAFPARYGRALLEIDAAFHCKILRDYFSLFIIVFPNQECLSRFFAEVVLL